MDNLNNLKQIWLSADTSSLPNSAEIVRMAKRFRNEKLRQKVLVIVTAIILTAMMVLVMFIYKSAMVTTKIGEVCMLITSGILIYTNVNSIGRFLRYKDFNNKEFLAFLEQTRANQIYFYQKTQVWGLIFCSVGLAFYLFETACANLMAGLILYLFTGGFLLINGFVIRPRKFKKQKEKLEKTIAQLHKVADQL
ncbi:hypothetical protein JN11_00088 [Mucilaginibacter frigoritolerans]|uniref:Uncharacterized protein n=1 Tax=Mucilaginibacter frigoritolerans TaxID=652788 RepID=A0A562UF21_9SPHI|nr:hypothetical protein [Mucilaginibacter frigoritolerans]TWJ04380.1 hypothetical protein JN11_00088 [Mucilaginibacter frigoritolerans]